jgi:transposase
VELLVGDMGYFKLEEIWRLQELGIETAIRDPQRNRRMDRLADADRAALEAARLTVSCDHGKALLKRRAEFVERSFEHVLDCGGARRTTLRGRENIRKRYLIQAACANLSLKITSRTHFNRLLRDCQEITDLHGQRAFGSIV